MRDKGTEGQRDKGRGDCVPTLSLCLSAHSPPCSSPTLSLCPFVPLSLLGFIHLDAFDFFRWVLGIIATVYATVVTAQSLWGWYVWLAGSDKYISMVRRYVIVQGLRLRFKTFWGDVVICILLCVAFLILWRAHVLIYDLGAKLRSIDNTNVALARHK